MEIDVSGLGNGFIFLAIGLALMGYFLGKGLQNFGHPDKGYKYNLLIKESVLQFYHVLTGCKTLNEKIISKTEISKWGTTASSALISSTTFSGG